MINVEEENNHFVSTLKNYEQRIGNYIEMDRKKVNFNNETNSYWIKSFDEDLIELKNVDNINSSKVSIKGTFVSNDLIFVNEYHENWAAFRDGASYAGIILIFIGWAIPTRFKIT